MPARIQRRRTPGWCAPGGAVYVGHPTRWANPFAVCQITGQRWQVIDTGGRSRSLVEEPQVFHEADQGLARLAATRLFELHIGALGLYRYDDQTMTDLRRELGGRDLTCWCPVPEPGEPDWCHAAVVPEIANT
ncbi:DUF4326 domain-containing protein [Streptomyces mobaraensis]|uniref:DUF4326 domain-containing protein n=1 Tax=Streptomyces mobaraensis TaxID=35621 RepID=A0A5N5W3T2_STRMB|nr:DUF4326 domain-containing protein [Streptomyces mobaraensis]KAB7839478.1 DUF4326 domain-containing protein [Streptomyces mobaraensis]